jgi:hypothetical protein
MWEPVEPVELLRTEPVELTPVELTPVELSRTEPVELTPVELTPVVELAPMLQ